MKNEIVKLSNIKKTFGYEPVLKGIDLSFKAGGFYSIIGRSGCGKSTLLRLINGLEKADEGEIIVDGIHLSKTSEKEIRKNVGMVFQSYQLFNHLNLISNIINPLLIVKKISRDEASDLGYSFLEKVGLKDHAEKYPHQLSGGQQQRGAIARALAMKPKVMLYDEPTSALDPELALEVHQVMKSIDHSMTQIIVTHEMRFARDISDEIIFMHQGSIGEIGSPQEIFSTPKLEATKEFLRNFL
jgi:ABC-type polar amino acid transport system ATPase subunit